VLKHPNTPRLQNSKNNYTGTVAVGNNSAVSD